MGKPRTNSNRPPPSAAMVMKGRLVFLGRMCREGRMEKAVAYAGLYNLPMPAWAEEHRKVEGEPAGVFLKYGDKIHLHDGREGLVIPYPKGPLEDGIVRLITSEGGAVNGQTMVGGKTFAEWKAEKERVYQEELEKAKVIPPFKPAREVLPVGVRWCQVITEARNPLLKVVRFEDNGSEEEMWLTMRQQAKGLGGRGRWVAAKWSDDVANGIGGWKLWVRGMD